MKYIKTYEQLDEEPQIGDYVIMTSYEWLNEFLHNNIGQIVFIGTQNQNDNINVIYPSNIITDDSYFRKITKYEHDIYDKFSSIARNNKKVSLRIFERNEILYFSKNKEDLEAKIAAKKYNL